MLKWYLLDFFVGGYKFLGPPLLRAWNNEKPKVRCMEVCTFCALLTFVSACTQTS